MKKSPTYVGEVVWENARLQFHNVREMDRGTKLFKCFTCEAWFDGGLHLDRNFNFISQEIEQCPVAQLDLFKP